MIEVFDYPAKLWPSEQLLRTPGQARQDGFTGSGARVLSPEPGGRAMLDFNYTGALRPGPSLRMYSWLASKISNGSVFRIKMWNSPQLAPLADLGLDSSNNGGLPWDGGAPWDGDTYWAYEPGVFSLAGALEGTMKIIVDFGALTHGLWHGHAIGIAGRAYLVDDIQYDGAQAEITLSMPIRADMAAGDFVTFRPTLHGVCLDPESFKGLFGAADIVRPGSITFAEAIL